MKYLLYIRSTGRVIALYSTKPEINEKTHGLILIDTTKMPKLDYLSKFRVMAGKLRRL